jgi:hypothetical protein
MIGMGSGFGVGDVERRWPLMDCTAGLLEDERMWIPWRNKAGLAKAAVILTTVLSIATVSCGVNYSLAMVSMDSQWAIGVLFVTAYVELAAMLASAIGLLVVLVIWLAIKMRATKAE